MVPQKSLVKESARRMRVAMPVLEQEHKLMQVAAAHQWPFRVLGVAPVPAEPLFYNNWWFLPAAADHSEIPARPLERVQAIYEAGIRPKAWVILHEARPQLPPPADAPKVSPLEFWAHRMAGHSLTVIKFTGTVLATVVVPLAVTVLGVSMMAALGLASVLLADPCLIAVTDDDVWVMVDSWMA
jgi:hypothetical protein